MNRNSQTRGKSFLRPGVRFDRGRHYRAKIGYILLATEQTVQDDVFRLRPDGVGVHFTRTPMPDSITGDTLAAQVEHLADAASRLLPDGSLDVVCYACTSGSLVVGEEQVFAELRKGSPDAEPTCLITSVIRALRAVGARSLVVATPYLDEVNEREASYLKNAGFDVLAIEGLGLERDSDMIRVAPDYLAEFAASIDRKEADALFISCSALRSLEVVDDLERRLGKPVIASNQAMIWDTFRLAGIDDRVTGHGTLLRDRSHGHAGTGPSNSDNENRC